MRTESIIRELNTLPKGYISKKKINGKEYSYLQFQEEGRLKSVYVRENELDFYYAGIKRRKELETELKAAENTGKTAPTVSSRARALTGSLMSGDVEVARFENGDIVYCDSKRAPLMLVRTRSVAGYLASRAIDGSRTNSRLVKKVLDIHGEPDEIVSLYAHGATVTDNFWFRAKGSHQRYEDICFDSDAYSEIALDGQVLIYNKRARLSPQLTLGGSYEKCWRLIDGEWWLYKRGTDFEIFSEIVSSNIAELMEIPTAMYEYADGYIRTKNFASEYNFEPMTSIAGEDDRPDTVLDALAKIGVNGDDYLRLLLFDAIVNNVDRHNENCGIMRDRKTGDIIGLAPNFDNNLSLVARTKTLNTEPRRDGLIQYLLKFVKRSSEAEAICKNMNWHDISEEQVRRCIDASGGGLCPEIDRGQLAKYIVGRYRYLREKLS